MDIRIQAIHFDASEKLVSFINKKIDGWHATMSTYPTPTSP